MVRVASACVCPLPPSPLIFSLTQHLHEASCLLVKREKGKRCKRKCFESCPSPFPVHKPPWPFLNISLETKIKSLQYLFFSVPCTQMTNCKENGEKENIKENVEKTRFPVCVVVVVDVFLRKMKTARADSNEKRTERTVEDKRHSLFSPHLKS